MHIASNLYIKLVTLGSPGSCSTGIKVTPAAEIASPAISRTAQLMYEFYYHSLHMKALEFATFVVRV